jgi:hypothetical protein
MSVIQMALGSAAGAPLLWVGANADGYSGGSAMSIDTPSARRTRDLLVHLVWVRNRSTLTLSPQGFTQRASSRVGAVHTKASDGAEDSVTAGWSSPGRAAIALAAIRGCVFGSADSPEDGQVIQPFTFPSKGGFSVMICGNRESDSIPATPGGWTSIAGIVANGSGVRVAYRQQDAGASDAVDFDNNDLRLSYCHAPAS